MVDNQNLLICSKKFTYLSLIQGSVLTSKKDGNKKKDIVTMYQNHSKDLTDLSIYGYFYKHFCKEVLKENGNQTKTTKHRILLPVGKNCKPCYTVTYDYAKEVSVGCFQKL